ncbi:MAG: aldose 1-epimerase [Solirubrobacterales bacterium]
MIGEGRLDGFDTLVLSSEEAAIEATFAPGAGMVGCSLRHDGAELLGQRGGLAASVAERTVMGIPLLYPWANRVTETRFQVGGREVNLESASPAPRRDPNGLPIHGLLTGAPGWRVDRRQSTEEGGSLGARFDFASQAGLLAAFPFPHELSTEISLEEATLTVATTVYASGGVDVPTSFGYHPFFKLPGAERSTWELDIPVSERLLLDERMIPTGGREPAEVEPGPLGSRTFDDAFLAPAGSAPLSVSGGGRRVAVTLGEGYRYTQVYAPEDDDVVALEPMTAPTNALVEGPPEPIVVPSGESFGAEFSITVTSS